MARRQRLSAADWIDAGLAALAEGGLTAVAVEPLAVRLGATKGSFYWHFPHRDALLAAVLERWERIDTEDVIRESAARPPGLTRLRALLVAAMGAEGVSTAQLQNALQDRADHPLVAPVLARVTARRLEHLGEVFGDLGFTGAAARHRAVLAYTTYLGHVQLARTTAGDAGTPADPAYVDTVLRVLTTPDPG